MMHSRQIHTFRAKSLGSMTSCYYSTRGALGGGFCDEDLRRWFVQESSNSDNGNRRQRHRRNNSDKHDSKGNIGEIFTDMYSQTVSSTCAMWLDRHPHPSSEMARAYFGSPRFTPEHLILTPFFTRENSSLPPKFEIGTKFMAWDTKVVSPYELICTWRISSASIHGCTMVGFDPMSRKVYHGNCMSTEWQSSAQFLLPLHKAYAQFLLGGMVNNLEKSSTSQS